MKPLCAALLLATLSLGGCCSFGSGCNMPTATAGRYDLDGLGQPPAEAPPSAAPKQRVSSRAKGQGDEMRSLYDNSNGSDNFEDDEARLKRKLIICQGCAVSGN
jgi:hypothetical protein